MSDVKALAIYDTVSGNTEKMAQAIAGRRKCQHLLSAKSFFAAAGEGPPPHGALAGAAQREL